MSPHIAPRLAICSMLSLVVRFISLVVRFFSVLTLVVKPPLVVLAQV